jgi:hypothetical protein
MGRRLLRDRQAIEISKLKARERDLRYSDSRNFWQLRAARTELFGSPKSCPAPPREIPDHLFDQFTMSGKVAIEYNYLDGTYPNN